MDTKIIVLLIFLVFGIIVSIAVAKGQINLTTIFNRHLMNTAEQNLGGVKMTVVSPVPGVYYQAEKLTSQQFLDLGSIMKITGQNLDNKILTISVATKNWYLYPTTTALSAGGADISSGLVKTVQYTFGTDLTYSSTTKDWTLASGNYLYLIRANTASSPFNLPEYVDLIFAVGETAKADVTIIVQPAE